MATLADVYRTINAMRDEGVIENYAIGGGMAALFYAETTATFDIDVFAVIPQSGLLIDLSKIYDWAKRNGHHLEKEHIVMHGVPVQFLIADDGLGAYAVQTGTTYDYAGVPVSVMTPEALILLYLRAASGKRKGRAADLLEAGADKIEISRLAEKFGMADEWAKFQNSIS